MFSFFRVLLIGFLFCGTQLLATVLYVPDAEFIPRYSGNTSVYNPVLAKFTSQVTVKEVYSNSAKDQFQMLNNGFQDIKLITWNIAPSSINSEIQFGLSLISDDVFKNFARSSVQAYSAWKTIQYNGKSRRVILIAFRGTEGFSDEGQIDWVVNLNAKEVNFNPTDSNITVHKGFFESVGAFEEITGQAKIGRETLAQVLENGKNSDDLFLVTGHSLGGALATVFAAKLIDPSYYRIKKDNLLVYTYGAPAVGNAHFKNIFFNEEVPPKNLATKLNLHRIRDVLDIVPYAAYITEFAKASQETKVFKYLDMSYLQKVAMAATIIKDDYTNEWPFQHIGYLRQYNNGAYEQNGDKLTPLLIPGLIAELAAGTPRHFIYTWAVDDNLAKAYQPKYAPILNMSPNDENQVYSNPKTFYLSSSDGTSSIHCDGLLNDMYGSGTITLYQTTSLLCYAMTATGETSPFIEKTIHISNANNAVDADGNDLSSTLYVAASSSTTSYNTTTKKFTAKAGDALTISFKDFDVCATPSVTKASQMKFQLVYADGDYGVDAPFTAGKYEMGLSIPKDGDFVIKNVGYYDEIKNNRLTTCGTTEKIAFDPASGGGSTTGDTTASLPVLHTGQTISYAVGDDAYYHAGKARSYTRDSTNNIVTDNVTGLMWQDNADAGTITKNWADAGAYCSDLIIGVYSDWRLPDVEELSSIANSGKSSPALDTVFVNFTSDSYWSSTTYNINILYAWIVNVYDGNTDSFGVKSYDNYVRCVRGGLLMP